VIQTQESRRGTGEDQWRGLVPLLAARDVAQALRIPLGQVYKLSASGVLPPIRIGRRLRWEERAVEELIDAGRHGQSRDGRSSA
jgi:hypothetical protein